MKIYRITWTLDNEGLEDLGCPRYETITAEYAKDTADRQLAYLADAQDRGRVTEYHVEEFEVEETPIVGMVGLRLI